jgi:hypothetical protein
VTLVPAADSWVEADLPATNFGAANRLRTDSSPDTKSFLRFDLSDVPDPIQSASLRLTPTISLTAGFEAHAVADTTWTEKGITYANAPDANAAAAGLSGPLTANVAASVDVSSAMPAKGGGLVSLALLPRSTAQLPLKSRETTAPPQLVLTVSHTSGIPLATTLPAVSDQEGNTTLLTTDHLGADPGTWTDSPTTFAYAWQACTADLASCHTVGTNNQVLTLTKKEAGFVIRVRVTATNAGGSGHANSPQTTTIVKQNLGHDPVIMAAGDIACGLKSVGGLCVDAATGSMLVAAHPDLVLPLGDDQYECGQISDFQNYYDHSWGQVKSITRPAVGNHEYTFDDNVTTSPCYQVPHGAPGYYTYFGSLGSPLDFRCGIWCKGYYSYDIGTWHLIALNSNCTRNGNCLAGNDQVTWLQSDLTAHAGQCILAYFHHPRWTSGQELDSAFMDTIYRLLYGAHADLILNGHDHDYERFAPLDPDGNVDPRNGIRELIVGTGGRNVTPFVSVHSGSELRDANTFGLLRLVLHPTSYDWQFVPALGATFTDAGSQPCHIAAANDAVAPSAPTGLSARAVISSRIDLLWRAATDDVGVVAYRIYRDGTLLKTIGNVHGFSDVSVPASSSHSYTVSAVDASGNESARSSPASATTPNPEAAPPIFVDGFETGTLDSWTNVTGNVVADTTGPASGAYAGHIVSTGAPAWAYNQFPPVSELWLRAKVKLNSVATQANLFRLRTFGAVAGKSVTTLTVYVTAAGRLGYRIEPTATDVVSTTTVSTGGWHTLRLHVRLGDASTGRIDTTLDGTAVPELTGPVAVQTNPMGRVQIGDAVSGDAYDAAFDDVLVSPVAPG